MNTQTNQEKRTIKVREFLDDFRAGYSDIEIMQKFNLTSVGLDKFFGMLVDRGILHQAELEEHYRIEQAKENRAESEKSTYMCPSCLSSHDVMFDICPKCGVSFQELLSQTSPDRNWEPESMEAKREFEPEKPEHGKNPTDIEIPTADFLQKDFKAQTEENDFLGADDLHKRHAGFDEAFDEIVPGMPLDLVDDAEQSSQFRCASCQEKLKTGLRDVYDRKRGKLALFISAGSLIGSFLGIAALGLLDGFSWFRLVTVYATGVGFISGTVFLAVGAFMNLAREKVYFCSSCGRIFPR